MKVAYYPNLTDMYRLPETVKLTLTEETIIEDKLNKYDDDRQTLETKPGKARIEHYENEKAKISVLTFGESSIPLTKLIKYIKEPIANYELGVVIGDPDEQEYYDEFSLSADNHLVHPLIKNNELIGYVFADEYALSPVPKYLMDKYYIEVDPGVLIVDEDTYAFDARWELNSAEFTHFFLDIMNKQYQLNLNEKKLEEMSQGVRYSLLEKLKDCPLDLTVRRNGDSIEIHHKDSEISFWERGGYDNYLTKVSDEEWQALSAYIVALTDKYGYFYIDIHGVNEDNHLNISSQIKGKYERVDIDQIKDLTSLMNLNNQSLSDALNDLMKDISITRENKNREDAKFYKENPDLLL